MQLLRNICAESYKAIFFSNGVSRETPLEKVPPYMLRGLFCVITIHMQDLLCFRISYGVKLFTKGLVYLIDNSFRGTLRL